MKRLLRKFIQLLPKRWRFYVIRRLVKLPSEEIPGLRVKIAHREHELEQAFSLLYDAYLASGFMTPNEARLRVTKYHALPSTTTIVAMVDDTVVGTVSVVRDGLFGFPSDRLIDKTDLRNTGVRIAEVSSLAVHERYRRQSHGAILWPLIAHLVRYSRDYFGTDFFAIAVHPRQFDFYEGVLFFEKLTPKVIKNYSFVNDNPAVCGLLNLRKFYDDLRYTYGHRSDEQNIFAYIMTTKHDFLRFPKRENFKISDPFLTPDLLRNFFREKTNVFEELTAKEIAILHGLYLREDYKSALPPLPMGSDSLLLERRTSRYDVNCKGQLLVGKRKIRMQVQNVSGEGLFAILSEDIRFGGEVEITIEVAEFLISSLVAVPVWSNNKKSYGFKLLATDGNWQRFLFNLNQDLNQDHSAPPFSIISEVG